MLLSANFVQTNLVSDVPGLAQVLDPNLVNPWGLTLGPNGPFWVANQGSGTSTLYNGLGQPQGGPLIVQIPINPDDPTPQPAHGSPTGDVFNTDPNGFNVTENGKTGSAIFLFATTDGVIAGWSPGVDFTHAIIGAKEDGAVFTGLAIGTTGSGASQQTMLYAADFSKDTIDVFNSNFKLVTSLPGNFNDPNLPANYRPFNIQNVDGKLFVTYAPFNPNTGGLLAGTGNGIVDVFNTDGTPDKAINGTGRLITGGVLNDPFGVALAPASFGAFGGDLLVGNFGNGTINAFNPTNGTFVGQLMTSSGQPFDVEHLWSLQFGNGAGTGLGTQNTLFFTAGLTSHFGAGSGTPHGLFGSLQAEAAVPANAPVVSNLPQAVQQNLSTNAPGGDQNPQGVAFVPQNFTGGGVLAPGDLLVTNSNNGANAPGTGSTIVKISPDGQQSVFFQGAPGLGLTGALGILPQGFVIVGSAPASGHNTFGDGSLLVLDSFGNVVETISDPSLIRAPSGLTINEVGKDQAEVFVSNALSGTVTRIDLSIPADGSKPVVESKTQIASDFKHGVNANGEFVGPTGLVFDAKTNMLYVAATGDNAIFAIANAGTTKTDLGKGRAVVQDPDHLHGPLGLLLAPNGDLIVSNGDALNPNALDTNAIDEFTTTGQFVGSFQIDGGKPGAASGIALQTIGSQVRFAAVDDHNNPNDSSPNTDTVNVFTFDPPSGSTGNSMGMSSSQPSMNAMSNSLRQIIAANNTSGIDAFFQSLDSIIETVEDNLERMNPQLAGMFQSFNSMVDSVEAIIAGHSIDDLSNAV
jgi:uncharacterized protein (TIGR03118 family)